MQHDIIQLATNYWGGKRDGQRMPTRASIDPADLAAVLPNLVMAEAIDGGKDYLHRIAGERAEILIGEHMHGERLSRLRGSSAILASWRNGMDLARTFKAPHFAQFENEESRMTVRAVFLPLSDGDENLAAFVMTALTDESPTIEE
jgi:hypothetical protein